MDYSIFLWHSYLEQQERFAGDKKRAMAHAIKATITSVVGSSVTTVAGFIALCFMSYTLGLDLGRVMAKGVVFGVIGCVTILPSMILVFDRLIEKTRHRPLMPKFDKLVNFVVKRFPAFLIIFVLILPAAYYISRGEKYTITWEPPCRIIWVMCRPPASWKKTLKQGLLIWYCWIRRFPPEM